MIPVNLWVYNDYEAAAGISTPTTRYVAQVFVQGQGVTRDGAPATEAMTTVGDTPTMALNGLSTKLQAFVNQGGELT